MVDGSRRVVFVLGMPRSGTSAITRGLQVLGVELGDRLMPAAPHNPRGLWEDLDAEAINDRVLSAFSRHWLSPGLVDDSQWHSAALETLAPEAERLLKSRLEQHRIWGFKDPRLCLVLPFWQPIFRRLGVDDSYVIVLRNPKAVADSLRASNQTVHEQSYLLWLERLYSALVYTSGKPRGLVEYDEMLRDPYEQLSRIAKALRLSAPLTPNDPALQSYQREFLDQSLRHYEHSDEDSAADSYLARAALRMFRSYRAVASDQSGSGEIDLASMVETLRTELVALGNMIPLAVQLYHQMQGWIQKFAASRERVQRLRLRVDQAKSELAASRAETAGLRAETARLRAETTRLKAENEGVRSMLLDEVAQLKNSGSWRAVTPIRKVIGGGAKEVEAVPASLPDAAQTVIAIRQSVWWELAAPLRVADRLLRGLRRRSKPPSPGSS